MTNTVLLEKKIAESGKKKGYLAQKVNLSRAGFRNCVINKADFTVTQVNALCSELGITSSKEMKEIFFTQSGSLNDQNKKG